MVLGVYGLWFRVYGLAFFWRGVFCWALGVGFRDMIRRQVQHTGSLPSPVQTTRDTTSTILESHRALAALDLNRTKAYEILNRPNFQHPKHPHPGALKPRKPLSPKFHENQRPTYNLQPPNKHSKNKATKPHAVHSSEHPCVTGAAGLIQVGKHVPRNVGALIIRIGF